MTSSSSDKSASHGGLMDKVYKRQRYIYDVTRKFYLLGRDRLIREIDPEPSTHILELACGTGRNLDIMAKNYFKCNLYGLDISSEMLASARQKLRTRVALAKGDACNFDPMALYGQDKFDHIMISYSLSMIPEWEAALEEALRHLSPGGTLHIVDFGDQAGLPNWFKAVLRKWLSQFHVTPRDTLGDVLQDLAAAQNAILTHNDLYRGYSQYAKVTLPS